MVPQPAESWQFVLELRQLDLRAGDLRLRAAREDVEDEFGPVNDLDVGRLLDLTTLRRPEIVVEDQQVGVVELRGRLDALQEALSNVGLPVDPCSVLHEAVDDRRSRRARELRELVQRLLFDLDGAVGKTDADEDGALFLGLVFLRYDRPPKLLEVLG